MAYKRFDSQGFSMDAGFGAGTAGPALGKPREPAYLFGQDRSPP